ncbi:LacI family DNA-binding transcriptional regulator [Nocardioides bruguierae]|uniref:LacI family DNA-binding transcriptional regulator n=1 Tax=Nocardioides bruguierae TaxID=2945102 RepID=UPI00202197FB|nr:LacI family DNA-binding transcriptional regulator [Nocardioides bruguierae]MCL8025315.1 LacI family DNA-binding transcriptional regulator [Nocardioides bruguierae]
MPARRSSPSMADVAAHVGVSHQTVSRVLNKSPLVRPETRERVEQAMKELGYRRNSAARALVTNRSARLGMVSAHLALHGPSRIAASVDAAAREVGYDVSLVGLETVSPSTVRVAVERLLDQAVEAVLVAAAHRPAIEAARAMDLPVPLVLVQGVEPGDHLAVGIDQVAGARAAVGHLLDLGHRRVAHVAGPLDWAEAVQRREGWLAAHRERDLEPGPELAGDWSAAGGHAAGALLAARDDVTAVFAANDATAMGLLKALHDAGLSLPDDLSVVGFDDSPEAAYTWPALTTVAQRFSELGERAVGLALQAIEGGTGQPPTPVPLLVPHLVVRDSAARA